MRLQELERLAADQPLRPNRRELLFMGGAAALVLAGCGGSKSKSSAVRHLSGTAAGGGKPVAQVNWGIVADPVGLDPIGPNDYQSVQPMYQCFDTVLQLNERNGISPMIASSWKQDDSTTYVYDIRDGVTFQDGSPMTVEDVAYSVNRHVDPKNESALADFVKSVKSVQTNGNNQLIVRLKEPDAMWKYILCLPVGMVVSKKDIERLQASGKKVGTPSALPLGTGAYRYVNWKRGESLSMARYENYWDKTRSLKVENLVFQIISDAEALATGLLEGSVQGTFQLNGQQIGPLAGQVQILESESVDVRILASNCQKPPFNDPKVRQAVSLATDKAGLLQSAYAGKGQLWKSPVMRNQWQFAQDTFSKAYDALPDFTTQDVKRARQLIQEAGATGARGNIIASSTEQQAQAVAVQQAAAQIGLKLSVEKVSGDELIAELFPEKPPHKWSMACWDWGADTPDPSSVLNIPFSSTNLSDFTEYKNPAVDRLLLQQSKMKDGEQRAKILTEVQSTIVRDQPWAILYWITQLTALSKSIGGLTVIPTWAYQHWAADLSGN